MKVSLNWLKDYVDLPRDLALDDLSQKLTMAGFEVEAVHNPGKNLVGVVVALVEEVQKHPNADKLSLCSVSIGNEKLRVVCGAANVRAGIKVALATIGAVLPGNFTIKRSKIRGEESQGMICSESELGLAETSEGILILSDGEVGAPVATVLDTVLELNITPNRPDALGHYGVAREVAALYGVNLREPLTGLAKGSAKPDLQVEIQDQDGCPAYLGRVLHGVASLESPAHVQKRLASVGLTSKNILVDATNYVMMELGQPTHAFDYRYLHGKKIIVRRAKAGEALKTLDGVDHKLDPQDLLICDTQGPVALAGIMGGEHSKIFDDTKDVVLECAYFKPALVRMTKRRLGIQSDSAYRFERGVDPQGLDLAMNRLTHLIMTWSQEKGVAAPQISELVAARHTLPAPREVALHTNHVAKRLGCVISAPEMLRLLTPLGFEKISGDEQAMKLRIPGFRVDVHQEIDLIEEIARRYGYDRIPATLPKLTQRPVRSQPALTAKAKAGEILRAYGFNETIHYTFVPAADHDTMNLAKDSPARNTVALKNPLAEDQAVMRTMLSPGLLRAVAYNINRGMQDVRLFECGKAFFQPPAGDKPVEYLLLSGVMTGNRQALSWANAQTPVDVFDLKGVIEALCESFSGLKADLKPIKGDAALEKMFPFLHPGLSGIYLSPQASGPHLGWMGAVHPQVLAGFDIKVPVFAFELDFSAFMKQLDAGFHFHTIPQFPAIRRDLAIVVSENLPSIEVNNLIFSLKNGMIGRVQLFDIYRGKQVPDGKKSLAYAIHYQSDERTLTHEEVDRVHEKVVERLAKEFGAEIRT